MIRLSLLCALMLPSLAARAAPGRGPQVAAGDAVRCTVRSIHGLEDQGAIDKRLEFLRKQLSKPPFSSYRTLTLLQVKELEIAQSTMASANLPSGKVLKLTFKEKLLGRKDDVRLRMHLSITPPKETRFLPGTLFTINNGGTLLVAGDKYKNGILVVGITCKTR